MQDQVLAESVGKGKRKKIDLTLISTLGDGTTVNKQSPVQIGTDKDWVLIAVGYTHTLALKSNATLWACGANAYGQSGDGTTVNKNSPVQIVEKW